MPENEDVTRKIQLGPLVEEPTGGSDGPYPVLWSSDDASAWARLRDMLKQAFTSPAPARRVLTWEEAKPALRLGHAASRRFPMRIWDAALSELLSIEWDLMKVQLPWAEARALVRDGFQLGRLDQAPCAR